VDTVSIAGSTGSGAPSYREKLEEQARRKGAAPIASVDELRADVFDSDAELDEFLDDLYAFRHANMA
jgi:hypothetical protein